MRRFALALLVAAVACGSDAPSSPTEVTFAGTYTLQTVNGQKLPYVLLQQGANAATLMDDRLTIADGGSWSETESWRITDNGVTSNQTIASAGTWLRSGANLLLTDGATNKTAYTGTFSQNRLDLTSSLGVHVWTK
jgi:hypothetical protein